MYVHIYPLFLYKQKPLFLNHSFLTVYSKILSEVWSDSHVTFVGWLLYIRSHSRWFFWLCLSSHAFFTTSEVNSSPISWLRRGRLCSLPVCGSVQKYKISIASLLTKVFLVIWSSIPRAFPQLPQHNKPSSGVYIENFSKAHFQEHVLFGPGF